jgi:MoxR-like ATPase
MPTQDTVQFNRKQLLDGVLATKLPPTATYPEGGTMEEFLATLVKGRISVLEKILAAAETGNPVLLYGRPGTAKTALARWAANALEAQLVTISPSASPDRLTIVGLGREDFDGTVTEFLDFMLEESVANPDTTKVILVEEPNRQPAFMQQQLLELTAAPHRISGHIVPNVLAVILTANRVEDGVEDLDPALSTRVVRVEVKAEDTGWQAHLATVFPGTNLSELFRAHGNLEPTLREQLTPRKMEKIVRALLLLGAARPALAMINSAYERFVDSAGVDKTDEILDSFARALGTPNREKLSDPFEAIVTMTVDHGLGTYVEGFPGIGKTTALEQRVRERMLELWPNDEPQILTISMANAAPGDWHQVMIRNGELRTTLLRFFAQPGRKVVIFDEIWRTAEDVRNMMLEVTNERTVGGRDIDLHGFIAISNPAQVDDFAMDVGIPDTAQADRFAASVVLGPEDIPWASYLITKYGPTAELFVEWWKGLPTRDKILYPPRVLEMAVKWWSAGMPLKDTLPWYDGAPLDLTFHELERALADRPLVKIRDVASRVDEFEVVLAGPNGNSTEEHRSVFDAFDRADIVQLREHREACERLMPLLSQQSKINLLRSAKAKRRFWLSVVNGGPEQDS